jgi:hypothetical protein
MGNITSHEARQIAEEAYVFGYPLLMNYRSHYVVAISEASPFFKAPYNHIVHDTKPADHTRRDVVAMNADTPYSNFGLDLRAEPVVVSVPDVPDRYYVMQCVDFYTHNFAYIGTRATGSKAGHYLFVGPKWQGEIPEGKFNQVFHCETDFAAVICRTQLKGLDDLENMVAVQQGYQITPLSVFMGKPPKSAPAVNWPDWDPAVVTSVNFIGLLNFLLPFCEPYHPDDVALMERLGKIGIAPGKPFDADELDPTIRQAIEAGQRAAIRKIAERVENIGEKVNGWNMTDACGPREFFKGDWLLRAAAAQAAMYMNDKIEAFYPLVFVDADGSTLDGTTNQYVLHFEEDEIPPAKYFWSVTMYDKSADGTAGYMVDNPIDRYLINSTTEGLIYGEDGSLTIYIQHKQPEGEKAANWLPAPTEPFYMAMRIYGPEESVMSGEWAPPPVEKPAD